MTSEQLAAGVSVLKAVAESIRLAGEIPSGHLYSAMCGTVDIGAYQRIIDILKRAGLVSESAHLLKWIGPELKGE